MPTVAVAIDSRRAKRGAADFDDATRRVKGSARNATTGVDRLNTRMDRLGQTASGLRSRMGTAFAGIGAALVLRDALRTIADFEFTMATVQGVTGATAEQFHRMSEAARELGATTKFSANEAAQGLLFLSRAGFDADQAVAALPHTLDLAAAGNLALGEAADYASNIVSQFNLQAEQTVRVADALVIVSNRANTDVRQLAEALTYAGPIAGALGETVETTAAAIGVLGDRGIQASIAGTNLRGVMLGLANPTKAAERALTRMGLTLDEVNPATQDFVDILERLRDAQMGAEAAGQIFGRRNAAAALILSESVEKLRDLEKATKDNAGEASDLNDIMADNLQGSLKALRSTVAELYLATGDKGLAGGFRSLVDTATGALRILVGMEDKVTTNYRQAQLLAGALKILGYTLGAVVLAKVAALVLSLGSLTAAVYGTVTSLAALKAAFLSNPIGIVLLGLSAVVAAAYASSGAFDAATEAAERHRIALLSVHQAATDLGTATDRYKHYMDDSEHGKALQELQKRAAAIDELRMKLEKLHGHGGKLHLKTKDSPGLEGLLDDVQKMNRAGVGIPIQGVRHTRNLMTGGTHTVSRTYIDRAVALRALARALAETKRKTEDLKAAVDAERQAQLDAKRAGVLKTQLLRSIKRAQGDVAVALNEETEAQRRASITRERYMEDARGIAKLLKLDEDATRAYLAEITKELDLLDKNQKLLDAKTAAEERAKAAKQAHEQAVRSATKTLETMLVNLRSQVVVLRAAAKGEEKFTEEMEARRAATVLLKNADVEGKKAIESKLQKVLDLLWVTRELTKAEEERQATELAQKSAADSLESFNKGLDRQLRLLKVTDEAERRALDARLRARELAEAAGMDGGGAAAAAEQRVRAIVAEERAQKVLSDELARRQEEVREQARAAKAFGDAWAGALEKFVTGSASAGEAARGLYQELLKLALQKLVLDKVSSFFGGLVGPSKEAAATTTNAFGNVYSGGRVVTQPEVFPMADGGVGVMGEAGEEGIFPLERRNGKLGIRASGGGGDTHVHMTVVTKDADSFRKSRRQILQDIRRGVRQ